MTEREDAAESARWEAAMVESQQRRQWREQLDPTDVRWLERQWTLATEERHMTGSLKVVTVGKAEDCDIRIVDEYASGHHARLFQRADGSVWAEDLGSTNGTRIIRAGVVAPDHFDAVRLGETVRWPVRIYPGDVLVVGRTRIPWTDGASGS